MGMGGHLDRTFWVVGGSSGVARRFGVWAGLSRGVVCGGAETGDCCCGTGEVLFPLGEKIAVFCADINEFGRREF